MKINCYLGIGYNDYREEVIDIDNNLTKEEIDREVEDWANNYIEYGYTVVE